MRVIHGFSIDVEDWYQSSYDFNAAISEICVWNTRHVLDFLSNYNVLGTFFIQGMVAKQYPFLVKEIFEKGHEVQSHGFSHRPIYSMNHNEFKWELTETNKCLEDITGKPVRWFRAPDFSIDKKSFWAFEVMYECGIRYDSSIFPLQTRRYGINDFERRYSTIETPSGSIGELPVSVLELIFPKGVRIPVGGGGYFRLFPSWFLNFCLRKLEEQGLPFIIYCHPYEFNPDEWKQILKDVTGYRRLHQGLGRQGFQNKVAQLFESSTFATMTDVLKRIIERGTENTCA